MGQVGRNDPCPCGSGKKYKKCCLHTEAQAPSLPPLPAYLQPGALAQRWKAEAGPVSDREGGHLRLWVDRYRVQREEAYAEVRALGRQDSGSVLVEREGRVVAELDLSIENELYLLTAELELADRLGEKLEKIAGIVHQGRHCDDLSALADTPAPVDGMIDFKKKFFKRWLDEPNQELEGQTPRKAIKTPRLRRRLLGLLERMEAKERALPKEERYSFKTIRRTLGLN